jgi:hypothetical protein
VKKLLLAESVQAGAIDVDDDVDDAVTCALDDTNKAVELLA